MAFTRPGSPSAGAPAALPLAPGHVASVSVCVQAVFRGQGRNEPWIQYLVSVAKSNVSPGWRPSLQRSHLMGGLARDNGVFQFMHVLGRSVLLNARRVSFSNCLGQFIRCEHLEGHVDTEGDPG